MGTSTCLGQNKNIKTRVIFGRDVQEGSICANGLPLCKPHPWVKRTPCFFALLGFDLSGGLSC